MIHDRSSHAFSAESATRGHEADPFAAWRAAQLACPSRRRRLDPAVDLAFWEEAAEHYDARSSLAVAAPGLIGWVAQHLKPADDVLDLGAGTGAFALPLAASGRSVSAVEPSPAMRTVLERRRSSEGLDNVRAVAAGWEDVQESPHAVVLAANSLYRVLDLRAWFETVHRLSQRLVIVILSEGRQPPLPPKVERLLLPKRVEPGAGPAELERALRTFLSAYRRTIWTVTRSYLFDDADDASRRLLGPFEPTRTQLARARQVIPTLMRRTDRGLRYDTEHRAFGFAWSPRGGRGPRGDPSR